MDCPDCLTDNPADARFCMGCGCALRQTCERCATASPAGARFCMGCGAPLAEVGARDEPRHELSVLFAEISGQAVLAERLDTQRVDALVSRCLHDLAGEATRHAGRVEKFVGFAVLATFGGPGSGGAGAEQAVRAALAMQEAMSAWNAELFVDGDAALTLRAGVSGGDTPGGRSEAATLVADIVEAARRLQAAARPGAVVVLERTMRASEHAIAYRALAPLRLPDRSEPVRAYEALEARQAAGEDPPAALPGSALVGRRRDVDEIRAAFERAIASHAPELVVVLGEAGVGKTRVLREAQQELADHDARPNFREGRCLPDGAGVVYWSVGEVLRAEFGIVDSDSAHTAREKLALRTDELLRGATNAAADADAATPARVALMARLLGLEPPADTPGDPERRREALFTTLHRMFEGMTAEHPLVVCLEDVHWADDGVLDLVEHVLSWARAPILMVCVARSSLVDRRPEWVRAQPGRTVVELAPLSDRDTGELVRRLLPGGAPPSMVTAVVERAGGNPLFAEEIARLLLERGDEDAGVLPATVHSLLSARVNALAPDERELLQHAAVVGRTFQPAALAQLAGEHGHDLDGVLDKLVARGLLARDREEAGGVAAEYSFRHVLVRDAAYGMLPKAVRARKHAQVGEFLEQRAGGRTEELVPVLAEHHRWAATLAREARMPDRELEPMRATAERFLEAAGDAAAGLYANVEALRHYEIARGLCDDPARRARLGEKLGDVALRQGRVDAAISAWEESLRHYRGEEDLLRVADLHRRIAAAHWQRGDAVAAGRHHQQGIKLLRDGPPSSVLVRLYDDAARQHAERGEAMPAIYAAENGLRLAEKLGDTGAAARAHGIFGRVFGRMGDSASARRHLERAVDLARSADEQETLDSLLALSSHLEIVQADYAGAGSAYAEALALAERLGDVPSQIELHAARARLAALTADWAEVERSSDASAALCEREGLVSKLSFSYVSRGLLAWRDGDWELAELVFGQARELALGSGWPEVVFSALIGLAGVQRDRGRAVAAADALDEARDVCERAGLVVLSVQAIAMRACALALDGRDRAAGEGAAEAAELAQRLRTPVGKAAALEAAGMAGDEDSAAVTRLEGAARGWTELGRPVDAARCRLHAGRRRLSADLDAGRTELLAAAGEFGRLGIEHQRRHALELAVGPG